MRSTSVAIGSSSRTSARPGLNYKGADNQTYERFDTEALASDDRQLRRFVFLLQAKSDGSAWDGPCHLDTLFQESEKVGR